MGLNTATYTCNPTREVISTTTLPEASVCDTLQVGAPERLGECVIAISESERKKFEFVQEDCCIQEFQYENSYGVGPEPFIGQCINQETPSFTQEGYTTCECPSGAPSFKVESIKLSKTFTVRSRTISTQAEEAQWVEFLCSKKKQMKIEIKNPEGEVIGCKWKEVILVGGNYKSFPNTKGGKVYSIEMAFSEDLK